MVRFDDCRGFCQYNCTRMGRTVPIVREFMTLLVTRTLRLRWHPRLVGHMGSDIYFLNLLYRNRVGLVVWEIASIVGLFRGTDRLGSERLASSTEFGHPGVFSLRF
jgi:hypothetical protein